jgi:ribosomal protein S18 acetylase RimI-like enzyme
MSVALRPLTEEEIAEVAPLIERGYAADIEQNGGLSAEAARRKAADDVPRVLGDPGNVLYAIEDDGNRVGHLWVGERQLQERRVLWVWDVYVDDEHRGRGLGRSAMALAEDEARRRGLTRVELNVFGGNEVARSLYRSLGYREWAVAMGKDLE